MIQYCTVHALTALWYIAHIMHLPAICTCTCETSAMKSDVGMPSAKKSSEEEVPFSITIKDTIIIQHSLA